MLAVPHTLSSALRHRLLRCSFCGRDEQVAERLVADAKAYICDTCMSECVAILDRHVSAEKPVSPVH